MTPVTTPPLPGSMEVPPLHGWVDILVPLLLIVVGVVAVLVFCASGKAGTDRSEWQAWLDGRSARDRDEEPPGPDAEGQPNLTGARLGT